MTEAHLAAGGDAIARHPDGRVVFVAGAAPEERVEARVVKDNRSFVRAELTGVLEPSPHRVDPPCPHYSTCGGCTLQHVAYEAQVESKQASLLDTLSRIGKIDVASVEVDPPWRGEPYGYRTRARLVLARDGQVGFRAAKSRKVVDVRQCPVLAPELQDVLTTLRAAYARAGALGKDAELSLVSNGEEVLAAFPPGLGGLSNTVAKAAGPKVTAGDAALADAQDGFGPLSLSPRVFAQSSRAGNAAMLEHIEAALPERVGLALDLYSGNGNFTRVLARHADAVEAFEGAREAVALARRAAPDNARVHLGSVAEALTKMVEEGRRADVVLLDPPRTGAEPEVLQAIGSASPSVVVYVSCDPATFARDAAHLTEGAGLRLRRIRLFDLYPQTGHSEVIGVFERAE